MEKAENKTRSSSVVTELSRSADEMGLSSADEIQHYPNYKPSGVNWLGDIPEHWEVGKLKSFLEVFGRIGFRGYTTNDLVDEGRGAITISPSNFGDSNLVWTKNSYLSWDKYYESPEIIVEVGDLLIVKTASIGKIAHVTELPEKATVNPQILVVKNVQEDNRFLFYQFLSIVFQTQLMKEKIGSTIYTISENKILNGFALLPPLQEQTAIAQFLDDKTTKIDQAIAIKEQQINLLKERKQILIHKLVTGQLVKTGDAWAEPVEVKDSGAEWIGEIPEHWEVKKLKEICKAFGRIGFRGYTTSDLVNEGEGAITISPSNIKEEFMTFEKCSYLSWKKYEESPEIQIFNNDVLIVKTGSTFGKIGIVKNLPQKATINPQLLVLKEIKINPDYFYSALKTSMIQIQVQQEVIGSTIPTISETKILNFKMALPPENEVGEIVLYLNDIREKFKTAIGLKQQEIEKLKEYKSSLINGVVTGKVKVC